MEYTAIDRASPEITKAKEILVTFVQGDHRSIPIQYSPFGNADENVLQDTLAYSFVTHVLDTVCIDFIPDMNTELYDGPGRNSEIVQIAGEYHGRHYFHCFRSFLGSALLSSNTQDNFTWNTTNNWTVHGSCDEHFYHGRWHFSAHDQGKGSRCMWEMKQAPEEIHIEQVLFHGFNMFMFMVDASYRDSYSFRICQYGGLYILYKHTTEEWNEYEPRHVSGNAVVYLSLCTNVYNEPSMRLPCDKNIYAKYLVFATFKHYSTGYVKVAVHNSTCNGYHYEFYPCQDHVHSLGFGKFGVFPYYYRNDKLREFWSTSDTGIPSCKAIWLMFNVDREGRELDSYCRVYNDFQSLIDVFMVGPQDIHINNSIIPLTQCKEDIKLLFFLNIFY